MYEDMTKEKIANDMLINIAGGYEKTPGHLNCDIVKSLSIEEAIIYKILDDIISMVDVDKLTGDDLTKYVLQRKGVIRKVGSYATVQLTINGQGTISTGNIFETPTGIQFTATDTTIINGTGQISVQCTTIGTIGMVAANTIIQMPVTIAGIISCTNASPAVNGYDAENDDSLRNRYYLQLQQPATSGNIYHYKQWAMETTGVGDAKVFSQWNGDNTVKIVIIDENKLPANSELVSTVQTYIDPLDTSGNPKGDGSGQAPIGALCTVQSASGKNINISVHVVKVSDNYTDNEIINNIKEAVADYLKTIAFIETTNYVSIARIGNAIFQADGVSDYSELTINGAEDNIPISMTSTLCEVAIIGDVSLIA